MAKSSKPKPRNASVRKRPDRPSLWRLVSFGWWIRLVLRGALVVLVALFGLVLLYSVVNPTATATMWAERRNLGAIEREWVPMERIAPEMARAAVAAEDANFCEHWGFDVRAIRAAIEAGATRGASTISQQTVKNVFLWQGRSWFRKALETALTPAVEAVWSKRRILEVYLNVAEFGEGVFGVEAAAQRYFGVPAAELSAREAALLAAVLPAPKDRSAARPSDRLSGRAAAIADGAATIRRDGRSACFDALPG
jgi:monofunctional biosynthetic peptidoglycan transglycosylase